MAVLIEIVFLSPIQLSFHWDQKQVFRLINTIVFYRIPFVENRDHENEMVHQYLCHRHQNLMMELQNLQQHMEVIYNIVKFDEAIFDHLINHHQTNRWFH